MNTQRRAFLKGSTAAGMLSVAAAAGLIKPTQVLASGWSKAGFEARSVPDTLKNLGIDSVIESGAISIRAPDIAETGATVPIEVNCKIAGAQSISMLVEKNPQPLAADIVLGSGMDAYVSTRLKMNGSSLVRVLVKANGKVYTASKEVKVTIGGCGGGSV